MVSMLIFIIVNLQKKLPKLFLLNYKILQKTIERMTVSHAFCVILKKTDRLGD